MEPSSSLSLWARIASSSACINDSLTNDELRAILARLEKFDDREAFGLVCKRWFHLESTKRRMLFAGAGPHMLPKFAARFNRLHELDLSRPMYQGFSVGVTDSDLSVVASGFMCLRVLNLLNCNSITNAGMKAIGCGLSSLQVLDVRNCGKLTDEGLLAVAKGCRDLRSMYLAGCRLVTDASLQAFSENSHKLEDLGLQGCTNITDSGLTDLVAGCQKIKYLDINKCSNVGDVGISNVAKACSLSLKTLKLLDCYRIGDESIFSLAKFCKNLETLVIGGCRDVSDVSIISMATACSQSLKNLQMDRCANISDSSLNCILSQCRNLEALDIGYCEEVTDAAFQGLSNSGVELGLKVLKVNNCPKITVAGIGMLLEICNFLEYLDMRSCPHVTKAGCDEAGLQFPENCTLFFSGS